MNNKIPFARVPSSIVHIPTNTISYLGFQSSYSRDYLFYEVSGRGHFPDDMLRYDVAEIEEDASPDADRADIRTYKIKAKRCTPARWSSFGWSVHPTVIHHRYRGRV